MHCVKSVQIRSFFWSVFSRMRTEYGEIRSISLYSVRMRANTEQKKLRIWTYFTQWYALQNICFLSVAKILKKYVWSSSYLVEVFFKENSHPHGKFTEKKLQFLYITFFEQILLRTLICSWWKKNQQNVSRKIKTWRYIVGVFTVLPCVTNWAMCFTDKYLWKTSANKLRGKSTTTATSKMEFFVKLVSAVNYCRKEIHCRCWRDPRYASETSYYKKFKNKQL